MLSKPLLCVALLLPFCIRAQEETRTLDWQQLTPSIKATKLAAPVPTGSFTILQLNNINKFLYKVEIRGSVFALSTPMPSELQALFGQGAQALSQMTGGNKAADEGVNKINGALEKMQGLLESKQLQLTNTQQNLADSSKKLNTLMQKQNNKGVGAQANDAAIKSLQQQVATYQTELYNQNEMVERMQRLVEACTKYRNLAEKVATSILELKMARSELVMIAQKDNQVAEIQAAAGKVNVPPASVRTDYMALKALFKEVKALYIAADYYQGQNNGYDRQLRLIKDALGEVSAADELIDSEGLIGLFSDVHFLKQELLNPANFQVTAPPVQMDGDLIRYKISITPTVTGTLQPYRNPTEFMVEVPAKGGTKIDFSVGPYIAMGKNAKGENYYLEEVAGQSTQVLRQRPNNNAISPGVAALMHCYPRTGKYNGLGGAIGVGAGAQDPANVNLSVFAGLSYVWGKMQKLMVSGGLAYLRVDRLKDNQYVVGREYDPGKIVLADVTEKAFRPSLFFSVSYNLSQRLEVK